MVKTLAHQTSNYNLPNLTDYIATRKQALQAPTDQEERIDEQVWPKESEPHLNNVQVLW